jgi:hypothetical protein
VTTDSPAAIDAVRARSRGALPLLAALAAAGAILLAVYPGFMSYDSLRALEEARTAVRGGDYPPFVSYVWRALDLIWPGPALMLFVQNFLLVLAFASILRKLGYPPLGIGAGVAVFCLVPPILGPMLVVWKDIGASACLCAAVACFLAAEGAARRRLAIGLGITMLFCGAAYRWNAVTAVVPLAAWFAWSGGFSGMRRASALVAGGTMFVGVALVVGVVDGYRFPDFVRLPGPLGIRRIMINDLAAMSALTGKDLVPRNGAAARDDAVEYFRRIDDPRHLDLVAARDTEGRLAAAFTVPEPIVRASYFAAIRDEPRAYVKRRTAVFRLLVGLDGERTYMPTHVGIDANDLGLDQRPTWLTRFVVAYVWVASATPLGKPWFWYLLGAGALVVALVRPGAHRAVAVAAAASGAFYLVPLYFVTPAVDVRYNHWSLVCASIVVAIALAPRRVECAA